MTMKSRHTAAKQRLREHSATIVCTLSFLCVLSSMSVLAAAGPIPGDPRCANFVCDLSQNDIASTSPDPAFRDSRTTGPGCLSDPIFDDLKKELNVGARPRGSIYLALPDWVSAMFSTQIFSILAAEVLGFDVQFAFQDTANTVLCCQQTAIWIETWPQDPVPNDVGIDSLYSLPLGYIGFAGLWIPQYTLDQYPLAQSFQAYQHLPEYKSLFPPAFSTPCNETLDDKSAACTDENRVCEMFSPEIWTNTTCTQGRYVPPQCVNNSDCQELYHVTPIWDSGFFEGVVKMLGLNFTIVYLGTSPSVGDYLVRAAHERKNMIYYMTGPDPVFAAIPSAEVHLPARADWCMNAENPDPTLAEANCTYPTSILTKLVRRSDIQSNPDLKRLFDAFTISNSRLDALMAEHYLGGGSDDVWNVSCKWVKENVETWKSWTYNTPLPVSPEASNIAVIAGVVAGIGGALILFVVIGLLYMRHHAQQATKNAPTKAPLALIFTDVESSTNLWEAYPCMAEAMEAHHAIIRGVIEQHECYEVKTIGDSFMIACPSMVEAMLLSLDIQTELMAYQWPDQLKYWKGDEESQPGCWNGLRVRAGIHWCQEIEPKLDTVHGRYDYYGHDVNVSARVESVASGGQTMLTEDSYKQMMSEPDSDLLEDMNCVVFSRGVELKGVASKVAVYSATPSSLAGRKFKPIPGAEAATDDAAPVLDFSKSHNSMASVMSEEASWIAAVKATLEYLPLPERQKLITSFLVDNKLMKSGESMSYAKKYQKYVKHLNNLNKNVSILTPQRKASNFGSMWSTHSDVQASIAMSPQKGK